MSLMYDRLQNDLSFALRGLRRTPVFLLTVTLILGVGIGVSTAMFSVFRTVFVQRLPVADQDHIVVMWTYRADEMTDYVSGTKDMIVVRQESRTMKDLAGIAHWPATPTPFRFGDRSLELNRGMVTGNFFQVLGARPALGRLFTNADDDPPGSAAGSITWHPLVLSYRAWREKFGGDTSRLLSALLFEVSPSDPVSLGGACVVLLAVGAIAAYLPARRASRIDPASALRAET
jgi:putative ABC transport system permease protein